LLVIAKPEAFLHRNKEYYVPLQNLVQDNCKYFKVAPTLVL